MLFSGAVLAAVLAPWTSVQTEGDQGRGLGEVL